jgi:RNA polymerase sigma-70 factor (ECF subfamily)
MGTALISPCLTGLPFGPSSSSVTFARSLPSAIVTGERSCFEAFQSELEYLFRTLRRLGVRGEDLEDEAHEVFLVLSRKWQEYDAARPLRPYLFGIAFRVVAASKRRRRREEPRALDEVTYDGAAPDALVEAARARELVLRALERVPLERRAVFVMHDIDEMPMREITRSLALPLFTGYSRLRKARREFEAAVKELQKGGRQP